MGGIVGQAQQYGLPVHEARKVPVAEIAELLTPPGIMAGLLNTRPVEGRDEI